MAAAVLAVAALAASPCYEAFEADFPKCTSYAEVGYVCAGGWCAVAGCQGHCDNCARRFDGHVPDPVTGRCVKPAAACDDPSSSSTVLLAVSAASFVAGRYSAGCAPDAMQISLALLGVGAGLKYCMLFQSAATMMMLSGVAVLGVWLVQRIFRVMSFATGGVVGVGVGMVACSHFGRCYAADLGALAEFVHKTLPFLPDC
eukprot:TRINITY_DN48066_c0_g1_i1.p1 TRINITY_DN48066_c0_g1~~TRINITY_DN48066_c0_g1_i1.p1  ORF type:complete len:218 (+),score=59.85 TRINITY_DN48066_c0_g1_i1:52-654(+)